MMTIPNLLTMGRMVLALLLPFIILFFNAPLLAFSIFAVAAITDFFDGWLARKLNQQTALGKMLDPISDKVIVSIVLLCINAQAGLSPWLLLPSMVIFFRETLVAGIREFLSGDLALASTRLAKWKTTLQLVALGLLLLQNTLGDPVYLAGIALLWIAMGVTAITGYDYCQKALQLLKETDRKPAS